jgi:hypothetical protein
MLAVQASCQFDTVYGARLRQRTARHLPCGDDHVRGPKTDMLRRADEWSLATTRRQESFDQTSTNKTLSSHLGSTLAYRRLMPANKQSVGYCCAAPLGWLPSYWTGRYRPGIGPVGTVVVARLAERHHAALERVRRSNHH